MQTSITYKHSRGFTLIEILLVIAILAILASIVIVAVNPRKQLADARDTERLHDVYTILQAVHQYALDHDGTYPEVLTTESQEICATSSNQCNSMYELTVLTDDDLYLTEIPVDPQCGLDYVSQPPCQEGGTGYFISLTDTGRVTVTAEGAENDDITITQ